MVGDDVRRVEGGEGCDSGGCEEDRGREGV